MEGGNSWRGGGRVRGRGRDGYDQNQPGAGGRGRGRGGNDQNQQGGGRGGGRGGGSHRGGYNQPQQGDRRAQPQQWEQIPMANLNLSGGAPSPWGGPQRPQFSQHGGGGTGAPQRPPVQQPRGSTQGAGPSRGPGIWSGRPWGPSAVSSPSPGGQRPQSQPPPQPIQPIQIAPVPVEVATRPSASLSSKNKYQPIKRPDKGGVIAVKKINLLVNHFPVTFSPEITIMHYDVDVKQQKTENERVKKLISKTELSMIRKQLSADNPSEFPLDLTVYDGEKNIFSAIPLPTGEFKVVLSRDDETAGRIYIFTIKLVAELKLAKLKEYLSGGLSHLPREIIQAMELVMKDNPSRKRISVGRYFFSKNYQQDEDFGFGVAAHRGFQQSLRPTSQGLALCLDYSVLAFRMSLPVLEFLEKYIGGFRVDQFYRFKRDIDKALIGLKINVTHRRSKQKHIIAKLSEKKTRQETFELQDPEGNDPPRTISLIDYFREKYGKEIVHKDIPCLDVGRGRLVPMEFCVLIEGQVFPKDELDRDTGIFVKKLSLPPPHLRQSTINEMLRANDGPCGEVSRNFGIGVEQSMTQVMGRVLPPPDLKLGGSNKVSVNEKSQWNFLGKSVVNAKPVERWALVDFTSRERYHKLRTSDFVANLKQRCRNMGIRMEDPLVYFPASMDDLNTANKVENILNLVVEEARKKSQGKLQIIVCPMCTRHNGYKYVKWVSETKIGVVTQCCLSSVFNKGKDQDLANLCKKINAKLGGSNFELIDRVPHFQGPEHVMFIGADVNHPGARNFMCPSIAAVVGTVNWPAANRYAARVCPQNHRTEQILNFGSMCSDLVNTYAKLNNVKPARIVVFRDGVSEGQFEMVLNEELIDLMRCIHVEGYKPPITFIVAQKRHHTRLFLKDRRDGGTSGNVPPGTVVDTKVVHPFEFDFYLCSHFGSLGTSKPTHYYVLWDENGFGSDHLQKMIYDLCFTFARCAKAVSLVPPVYYADLVAYRGRLFQEVVKERQFQAPGSSSSSSASSAAPSADASFQQEFYNLHPDLKNIMFFV